MAVGSLFFLSVAGWALLLMLLLPRLKAGHALLSALCGMFFFAYLGVIVLQAMAPTAYLLLYGGLACFAAGLAGAAANVRGLRRRVCTVGMAGYLLLALAAALLLRGVPVDDHDSLSYWARIVKELFVYQRFPINGDSTMFHSDYFPLMGALQYCVMQVFGWQDEYLLFVTFSCIAASVAAVADLFSKKLWGAAAVVLLPYAFAVFGSPLFSTRADGPISALFSAALLCLFLREEDSPAAWLPTFCAAVVLTGFKIYTGLMLSLVLCACMLLSVRGAAGQDRALRRRLLGLGGLAVALCLLLQFSWSGLYHYMSRLAAYDAAAAAASYTGVAFEGVRPVFALRDLFTGNPRTGSLLSTLTPEAFQSVGVLISGTFAGYGSSRLPWLWLFLLPVVLVAVLAPKARRRRILAALAAALAAGVLYLLGLFGSYFVQAETYGAAVGYLVTVTTPLLWLALTVLLKAAQGGQTALPGRVALPLAAAGMLLLLPPASFAGDVALTHEPADYAALAAEYYGSEIADQLVPEDQTRHALVIDCSYAASEVKSESGKTHAYQYYAMPMYVTVLQYPYANYDLLDSVNAETLLGTLNADRCDLLLLRIEDDLYWEAVQDALSLDGDWDEPTAVYDIIREDGEIRFHCRLDEE